jgi:hypothetical protein
VDFAVAESTRVAVTSAADVGRFREGPALQRVPADELAQHIPPTVELALPPPKQ